MLSKTTARANQKDLQWGAVGEPAGHLIVHVSQNLGMMDDPHQLSKLRSPKRLWICLTTQVGVCRMAKIHYTSNHIICLDFVWIAIQRPKIVWMNPKLVWTSIPQISQSYPGVILSSSSALQSQHIQKNGPLFSFLEQDWIFRPHSQLLARLTYRLGICQKIYTTQFSGEKILHTENA